LITVNAAAELRRRYRPFTHRYRIVPPRCCRVYLRARRWNGDCPVIAPDHERRPAMRTLWSQWTRWTRRDAARRSTHSLDAERWLQSLREAGL
jgi:hypothetical protein